MRVLVADDDDIARDLLVNMLVRSGYEVATASNGLEALALIQQANYRLVLTDWEMPEMSGTDLCRLVRNGDFTGYVYMILVTSRNGRQETIEGLSAGADDFVKKPFDPEELLVRVRAGERILSLETRDVTIFALARLAESRDPETGAHLERVRSYCRVLAAHLMTLPKFVDQIDSEYLRLIYRTSPLHDIGKVGIPDSVLLKPGQLNDREFAIMKSHTELGAETLAAALAEFPQARFLEMARDIAATHHERFDGSGYPRGLVGEAIPLAGRIVALADVYDALTSKRVYKPAHSHEVSRSIILEGRGSHFDPDIVDAFLACEHQFIQIHAKYQELANREAKPAPPGQGPQGPWTAPEGQLTGSLFGSLVAGS